MFSIFKSNRKAQEFHNSPNEWALNYGFFKVGKSGSTMLGLSYLKQGFLEEYNRLNVFLGGDFNYVHHPFNTGGNLHKWYIQTNIYAGPGIIFNKWGPRFHPYVALMAGVNLDIIHDPGNQFEPETDFFWEAYDTRKVRLLTQISLGVDYNFGEMDSYQHSDYTLSIRYNYSNMIFHHLSIGWVYRIK